jgi:hypothetical protein
MDETNGVPSKLCQLVYCNAFHFCWAMNMPNGKQKYRKPNRKSKQISAARSRRAAATQLAADDLRMFVLETN